MKRESASKSYSLEHTADGKKVPAIDGNVRRSEAVDLRDVGQ
jgi:hypothetical protein